MLGFRHLDDTTGAVWRHIMVVTSYFYCIGFGYKDIALKTHPFIVTVVSR